uniref:uncharacterized protein LOC122773540 n=1 Tax=Solea senegalensis TaxID=28829 RepID=UPI001CD844E1|nr:uncharacterized protein LOC122773540 [Solea senegalensis]
MRPTTSIMLQQNNNNNYPCLNMSGSTREMLQKCSRPSLPFPSRLELGLGDLPLIRGLRAWALCSKNRCKAGGVLGGMQAPTAPPAGQGSSTSCPRPADVYLSGEWNRMGYGLPLGLDARQAGIGALVTVASLKTSEGSGKTQTQCLFLRTEKGNCLYSTAKPGSRAITGAVSSGVGGWLRGKTGGRDNPVGRKDNRPNLMVQPGANRVRVRSGRRWRKSGNVAGREKASVSKERRQRSREGPAGERQEEQDKGGLDSLQQDGRRGRQEKEAVCRSPRSFYSVSSKTYAQYGRRAQRKEDEGEGGENLKAGFPSGHNSDGKGMRKEKQKNAEEEDEEEGGLCELESSNSVLAESKPDLESNCLHPQSLSGCDGEENVNSNEELKIQTSDGVEDISEREQDTNSGVMKVNIRNDDFIHVHSGQLTDSFTSRHHRDFSDRASTENPSEEILANVNRFSDVESQKEMERVVGEERSVNESLSKFSNVSKCEDVSLSPCLASISTAVSSGSSTPAEGSIHSADHAAGLVKGEKETDREGRPPEESDPAIMGVVRLDPLEPNCVAEEDSSEAQIYFQNEENNRQVEEREAPPSPLRHTDPSISGTTTENSSVMTESQLRHEEQENKEETSGSEAEEVRRREHTCRELDSASVNRHDSETSVGVILEDNYEKESCSSEDKGRPQGGREEDDEEDDTCGETNVAHREENGEMSANTSYVACANPITSHALSLVNPDPSLGSMATCVQEEVEEGVELRATAEDGGQEGSWRYGREPEELCEEDRGSTLATEDIRKEEEEEEEGEDEFGVFMQAEEEPLWSEGISMSASVPCGIKESVGLGNHIPTAESTLWTPGWTDSSFHQSDDAWTAFPQESSDEGGDVVGQWWPRSAVKDRRDGLSANQSVESVFAESFPSLPGSSSSDRCDLDTVPTLTQLLRGRTNQDQGLLDSFHDLNKMIGQRFKRANGVSRDLLLTTLHLEQPHTDSPPPNSYNVIQTYEKFNGHTYREPRSDEAKRRQKCFLSAAPRGDFFLPCDPNMPGPGQYNPSVKSFPQMTLITSRQDRFKDAMNTNPGPSTYQVKRL